MISNSSLRAVNGVTGSGGWSMTDSESQQTNGGTYIASSKFFSAMALLPAALSSSAMIEVSLLEFFGI
jgi:hypothetical protein